LGTKRKKFLLLNLVGKPAELFAFTESRCETLVVAEVTWETGRNT
jgi:hypothetical protein